MRILWVTNHQLPKLANYTGETRATSGSWLVNLSKDLAKNPNIELCIACPTKGESQTIEIDGIKYVLLPMSSWDKFVSPSKKLLSLCDAILSELSPDIIHLQGSEFAYNLAFTRQSEIPVVVSIQGLISEISKKKYFLNDINNIDVSTYAIEKLKYFRNRLRSRSEIKLLQSTKFIIGRTLWDECHTKFYNPESIRFHLQEKMRSAFEHKTWDLETIINHSIFAAGGYASPLKGAHRVLEAVSLLIKEFPDIVISFPGQDIFSKKRMIGYPRYLKNLIIRLGLKNNVKFLGNLNEVEMALQFQKSHVYVMGSNIENSSNTFGEALCIGVPSVVPFVGGIPSLASNEIECLFYTYNDLEQLAWQVRRIFCDDNLAVNLHDSARELAKKQYWFPNITSELIKIYNIL